MIANFSQHKSNGNDQLMNISRHQSRMWGGILISNLVFSDYKRMFSDSIGAFSENRKIRSAVGLGNYGLQGFALHSRYAPLEYAVARIEKSVGLIGY
jgi:hypothetical protein